MVHSYQSHNYLASSADALYLKKKHNEKLAKMRAEGTYCDTLEPDRSYMNFKDNRCMKCPNYEECKEQVNKRMEQWSGRHYDPLVRKKKTSKPKAKKKKGCGCK